MSVLDRRTLIAGALALGVAPPHAALAGPPASGRLRFTVFRNGKSVGEHVVSFVVNGDSVAVTTEAAMTIKLGPVPVFKYRHHAEERWRGGRIQTLSTRTDSNGKKEAVSASRTTAGVVIEAAGSRINAPAAINPLSHWNSAILEGPLFNPQTGKLMKLTATPRGRGQVRFANGATLAAASHWALRGETEIDDYYDEAGVWMALRGILEDKSTMEYRRA